jgi:hypothetical protein
MIIECFDISPTEGLTSTGLLPDFFFHGFLSFPFLLNMLVMCEAIMFSHYVTSLFFNLLIHKVIHLMNRIYILVSNL